MNARRPLVSLIAALALGLVVGAAAPASSGGRIAATGATALPASAPGEQIAWAIAQINGGAESLTAEDVAAHFTPHFLATLPAPVIVKVLQDNARQLGPIRLRGLAGHPSSTSLIALIETRRGMKAAIYATVERRSPHRLTGFEITDRPDLGASEIASPGPYTGPFPVGGGRTLFLNCTGTGSPTVILEAGAGGGSNSWRKVQRPLSQHTRVCSYDRANLPGGSSTPAPKPQTANDIVRDLHRALAAARVPTPYVFAGHSNGGLYARLYASYHPADVVGLVLVDSISEEQPARERALLRKLLPARQWQLWLQQQRHPPPFVEYVGDEQVDIPTSYKQMAAAARTKPLPNMPLTVISHGIADPIGAQGVKGLQRGVEQIWQTMQVDLAKLLPGGQRIIAETSHHQIPAERPNIVVKALMQIISQSR